MMIAHIALGQNAEQRRKQLRYLIAKGKINFGGYRLGKIFGTLSCAAGKKMKVENRVFFGSIAEALQVGYRPCGQCMKREYKQWKTEASRRL